MTTFDEYLAEKMKRPDFKAAWDKLQPASELKTKVVIYMYTFGLNKRQLAKEAGVCKKTITSVLDLVDVSDKNRAKILAAVNIDFVEV